MVIFSVTFGHFSNFHGFFPASGGGTPVSFYHILIISGDRDVVARTQIDEVKSNMPCIMDLGNPALRRGRFFWVCAAKNYWVYWEYM